ncbi:MAG: hypothetical protein ACFB51_07705 [Anaerolineae bacterium]
MFTPDVKDEIRLNGKRYSFAPHPVVPSIPWGQEGRRAIVYRLDPIGAGKPYALKVFRQVFRHEGLIEAAATLEGFRDLPGMDVCDQTVLREHTHPELVTQYPDLDYAMLMPWIEGETWFDVLNLRKPLTLDQSRAIAESMSWVLYALEYNRLAHCDLSSGNVIVEPNGVDVQLIDVEDVYSPYLVPPPFVPVGTMGYQHHAVPHAPTGQWSPMGDRFAGAVLMAEMLAWAHPDIREAAHGESYFAPGELHAASERYDLLRDVLRVYNPAFAETFEQAWRSTSLDSCPPIERWYLLFDNLPRDPVREWAPIEAAGFAAPEDPAAADRPPVSAGGDVPPAAPFDDEEEDEDADAANSQRAARRQGCRTVVVVMGVATVVCCYSALIFGQFGSLLEWF